MVSDVAFAYDHDTGMLVELVPDTVPGLFSMVTVSLSLDAVTLSPASFETHFFAELHVNPEPTTLHWSFVPATLMDGHTAALCGTAASATVTSAIAGITPRQRNVSIASSTRFIVR